MQNRKSILDLFKYFFTVNFIYFEILIKARVIACFHEETF